MKATKD